MKKMKCRSVLIFGVLLITALQGANVVLPNFYSDHMILQRNRPIPISGRATAGSLITVKLGNTQVSQKVDASGKWQVILPPRAATLKPLKLTISDEATFRKEYSDVLIGDVWFASGQSNIAFCLIDSNNSNEAEAIDAIRLFTVVEHMSRTPSDDVAGSWSVATKESSLMFSAIGYLFAKKLYQELKIPIGIINSSRGGTGIESWLDSKSLSEVTKKDYSSIAKGNEQLTGEPVEIVLFNGMVHPWRLYPISGVLWYQGESNAYRNHEEYGQMFPKLLTSFRQNWQDANLPFIFVQLAAFLRHNPNEKLPDNYAQIHDPNDFGIWAAFRPIQAQLLKNSYTGMAVAIDAGDPFDIHPKDKLTIANRLAAEALRIHYKKNIISQSPYFKKMEIKDNQAILTFDNPKSKLRQCENLNNFIIRSADGKFEKAIAKVIGENQISVSSPNITKPFEVRYCWSDYPFEVNFYNLENFPVPPFQATAEH